MNGGIGEEQIDGYPGPVFKREAEVKGSTKRARIDPAVREWLDTVLVPAMVRLYLASSERVVDNGVVPVTERVQ